MTCFSWLKGLETQPWLGLCNLFISFQAGLCELIHGGWAEEAGEGSKHKYRKQTKQQGSAAPCFGVGAGAGKTGRGMKLWGLPRGIRPGRETGASTDASPSPSRSPASVSAPGAPTAVGSHLWPFSRLLGKGGEVEGRPERQQEGEAWPPGAAPHGLLPAQPLPQPHRHRQACRAPRVPETAPHPRSRFRTPATESDCRALGFSARFACDLHTSATPPHSNSRRFQVKGCETK